MAKKYKGKNGEMYTKEELIKIAGEIIVKILYHHGGEMEHDELEYTYHRVWDKMGLPEI